MTWALLFKLRLLTLLSLSHINMTIMPNTSPVGQVFFLRPWLKVSSLTKSNWHALLQLSACPTATSGLWAQAEAVSSILSHCPSSFKDLLRRDVFVQNWVKKQKFRKKFFPETLLKEEQQHLLHMLRFHFFNSISLLQLFSNFQFPKMQQLFWKLFLQVVRSSDCFSGKVFLSSLTTVSSAHYEQGRSLYLPRIWAIYWNGCPNHPWVVCY